MNTKTPTESVLRRKAACRGYKLTKLRENSRWYYQYGPYMLAEAATNFTVQYGLTADEINGWLIGDEQHPAVAVAKEAV